MSTIENSRTTVLPGDGRVHRSLGVALVLPILTAQQLAQAQELLKACDRAAHDPSGRTTVRTIAALIGTDDFPSFGLALDTTQGLVVMLHERAGAEIQPLGGEPVRLHGTDSLAWVERRFTGPVANFHLWTSDRPHQTYPGTDGAAMEGIPLNLSRGTLPGAGVVVTALTLEKADEEEDPDLMVTAERHPRVSATNEGPVPEAPTEDQAALTQNVAAAMDHERSHGSLLPPTPHFGQPQIEPDMHPPVEAAQAGFPIRSHLQPYAETAAVQPAKDPPQPLRTPGGGLAVPRPNVPPIEGVLCAHGHFTDPKAAYCAICGISMQQVTRRFTRRPRPTLGVLVLDDGTSRTIDGDLIIGRDPMTHPAVAAGDARPMYLNDEVNGVSRVHARITLLDWSVCLSDESSANGTYLLDATGNHALTGEDAVELTSGTVIRIGRRTLTFDGYHSAGE